MNSQSTPVHIRLWHREFWLMAIANFLLAMSVYILVPTLPRWLLSTQHLSPMEIGVAMGAFGLGLFLLGMFVSFLVQHFRRNVVCIWAKTLSPIPTSVAPRPVGNWVRSFSRRMASILSNSVTAVPIIRKPLWRRWPRLTA